MTELVLKIKKQEDVELLLNLAKRLGVSYQLKSIAAQNKKLEKLHAIINKGVSYSSFGDAADYQRTIRQ